MIVVVSENPLEETQIDAYRLVNRVDTIARAPLAGRHEAYLARCGVGPRGGSYCRIST